MKDDYIHIARSKFSKLPLTDSYKSKKFTKNFGAHLNLLIETSESLDATASSIYLDRDFVINDRIYWQTEAMILENLDDVVDVNVLKDLENLEDELYESIKISLGKNYNKTTELNKIIDNTVHSALLSVKYNYFSKKDEYNNPWEDAKNILTENEVLYSFSSDIGELSSLGYKPSKKDSEDIKFKKIGIIGKGYRPSYTFSYVRDLIGLRNTVFQILDDKANSRSNPINTQHIIKELRDMGIDSNDLSDGQISALLIAPLKRGNKIGSCTEGYFVMHDIEDVEVSYKSHLETFQGFYNTLENHRQLAIKLGSTDSKFEAHRKLFKYENEQ